jgi:hypothetical protein
MHLLIEAVRVAHGWSLVVPGVAVVAVERLRGAEQLVRELVAQHHGEDPSGVTVELRPRRLSE